MKRSFYGLLMVMMAGCIATAEAEIAVTVYNQNLGVVREVRPFELSEGVHNLLFKEVAAQIDPTSVSLTGPEGFKVLEQNYDFDLVSSDKLLGKYLGKKLSLVDKSGKTFEGPLLSFDGGQIVLGTEGGGAKMLSRPEMVQMDFPSLPGGLITEPTLAWMVRSPVSGTKDLTLTYMTGGINWHCEYVALVAPDEKNLDLTGWVSVDNQCGASFKEAKLKLVAGEVHRAEPNEKVRIMELAVAAAPAQDQAFQEKSFFEYHLYTLNRPVDLANDQIKQVELLKAASAAVRKVYTYDASVDAKKVKVELELKNSKASGMGLPLPAGKMRVYKADTDKSLEFIGEDSVDHTPVDEKLRVEMGNSFDIIGEHLQLKQTKVRDRVWDTEVEIKLRNHRKETAQVVAVEHAWGDWEITAKSQEYYKKDANTFEFYLDIPADKEAVVTYTVRMVR